MSKAFVKDSDDEQEFDQDEADNSLPQGYKNYITPRGYQALLQELNHLIKQERPQVVEAVHWAAKNGDRSENGDYIYGKKRLREIDRRIRFLSKRIAIAVVVDPSVHFGKETVFFGGCVRYCDERGLESLIHIVGVDEADITRHEVSWISPVAKALIGASVGDTVRVQTPQGIRELEILAVDYPSPEAG